MAARSEALNGAMAAGSVTSYRKKRNFQRTPEPKGGAKKASGKESRFL
jgi:hypothetical protein